MSDKVKKTFDATRMLVCMAITRNRETGQYTNRIVLACCLAHGAEAIQQRYGEPVVASSILAENESITIAATLMSDPEGEPNLPTLDGEVIH